MLAKILVTLSVWFLLSMVLGLIVGKAISMLQKSHSLGFASPLETDWETLALNELEGEEILVLSDAQMQEVC
jgi:hypothetical protein